MPFGVPDNLFNYSTGRLRTPSYDPTKSLYDTIMEGDAPPPSLPSSLVPRGTLKTPVATLDAVPSVTLPPPIDPSKYKKG